MYGYISNFLYIGTGHLLISYRFSKICSKIPEKYEISVVKSLFIEETLKIIEHRKSILYNY